MAHILKISRNDPIIHLKAYGGLKIKGIDPTEVHCEIDAPELATLVEDNGHVYITANTSCAVMVPVASSIEIEKGMGSVSIENIKNHIQIEKVFGNLVLTDVESAHIEKVGGNFSVKNASGEIYLEKINANLVVDEVASFHCEKVGGNATVRNVQGEVYLTKTGGNFRAEGIAGQMQFEKAGGSLIARSVKVNGDIKAGGDIRLIDFDFGDDLELHAGGEVELEVAEGFAGANLEFRSGGHKIIIKAGDVDMTISDSILEYQLGEKNRTLSASAGGNVSLTEGFDLEEDIIGDLSSYFAYEESAFSELIQERVESATRRADARVRVAEKRLGQIQDRVEKKRGFNVDLNVGGRSISFTSDAPSAPSAPPAPPMTRPAGKKGATDEERLMILQMLQEKKISVDEAEALFKALED